MPLKGRLGIAQSQLANLSAFSAKYHNIPNWRSKEGTEHHNNH